VISQYRKGQLGLFQIGEGGTILSSRVLASLNFAFQQILGAFPPGSRFSSEQLYAKILTRDGETQRHARRRWKDLKYNYGFDVDFDGSQYWRGGTNEPVNDPALRPNDKLIREHFLPMLASNSIKLTADSLPHCNNCDARVIFKDSIYQDILFDDQGLIDHRRPVFQAGDDSEENLQILCQTCNNKKNTVCRACPFEFKCERCLWAFPEKARARRLILYLDEEVSVQLRKRYGSDLENKAAELLAETVRRQIS
jgi:5-methylcytosine-specific restriction endonuclease McrA